VVIEELLLSKKEEEDYLLKFDKVMRRLKDTAQTKEYTYDVFVLDPKGTIIASSDEEDIGKDKSNDPCFLGGKERIFIKDAYISSSKQRKTLAFSAPILSKEDNRFLGVVVLRESSEVLSQITTDRTGLGETEEVKDIDMMEKVYPDLDYRKQAIEYMQKASTEWREFRIQSKSGKIINSEWSNIRLDDGTQIGIGMDITERKQAQERLKKTLDATIETVSKIIEVKDPYTSGHQQRVSQLTTAIAKELNLSQDKIEGVRIASLIHDIGKIGVPTEILSKTTTLSDIEFSLIKEHSQIGYDILKYIDFSYPVAQIVLQHHEKVNGTGYPKGLKGDEILLEAKIICVADVVEAMSSHRPYRPAFGIDKALEDISKKKGILYDPKVVDICLKLFKEKEFKF